MRAIRSAEFNAFARPLFGSLAIVLAFALLAFNVQPTVTANSSQDAPDSPQATFPADAPSLGAVPDGPGAAGTCGADRNVTFTVAGMVAPLTNVEVSLTMTHTWVGDIEGALVSPAGVATHLLFSRTGATTAASFGDSSDLLGPYNFRDSAAGTHWWTAAATAGAAAPVAAGDYRTVAAGPSAANPALTTMTTTFAGLTTGQANGTWTLRMRDCGGGDTGSVTAATLTLVGAVAGVYRPLYDFTGDGSTDFTVLTLGAAGSPITWRTLRNPAVPGPAFIRFFDFGLVGDSITAGDYLGDGKTEVSVWRTGTFYHSPFPEGPGPIGPVTVVNWGMAGDNLGRVGDYDDDGKDDETVIRVVSNVLQWHIRGSAGTNRVTPFGSLAAGISTLAFQGADFTGDGREELVVCQVTNATGSGQWLIGDSITGAVILTVNFGNFNTDFFINPDDYSGDGKADIVVWRALSAAPDAGSWYIRDTNTGSLLPVVIFGISDATAVNNDIPLRGNYDGDNKADIAVYRPSNTTWYWLRSSDGTLGFQEWKPLFPDDVPLPNFFTF